MRPVNCRNGPSPDATHSNGICRGGSRTARVSGALQGEAESRAVAEVALDIHGAAVRFDEAACDRESQSGAGGTILLGASPRLFDAERAFEDPRQVFRGYALARVGDLNMCLLPFARGAQCYGAVSRGVAQGVGDEVVEYAL